MRVHLCGVRGSTPAPGAEFLRYGGHTSSVAISHDDAAGPVLVLDAGTGLRQVTSLLGGEPFSGTILLTHLHWDHVHGLPFFRAGDRDGARVTLLLPAQESGESAAAALARGMSPPHFPIGPEGLRGDWMFGSLAPGQFKAEGFTVEAREVPHKGGRTYGYLLIHDAFLLAAEVPAEAAFGHAAAEYAAGLGVRAGARRVALAHHKPDRTDDELDALARSFADGRQAGPGTSGDPEIFVAAEGGILEL